MPQYHSRFYTYQIHQLVIDLKKAYDSVRREVLNNILIEFRVPMKLVKVGPVLN
jgi:hypothetical protein